MYTTNQMSFSYYVIIITHMELKQNEQKSLSGYLHVVNLPIKVLRIRFQT